jgi:hypothetical protein
MNHFQPTGIYFLHALRGQQEHILPCPPKEYQEKLRKCHGRKVKVLVVVESE